MRIMRVGERGAERPAVEHEGVVHDLAGLTDEIDGAFLAAGGLERVSEALEAGTLPVLPDAATLRCGSPIARPVAIVGIGLNYVAHAREAGKTPGPYPIAFIIHPGAIAGPDDDVVLPRRARHLDWEVELGVVIGRRLWQADSPAEALEHVAGYVVVNDLSERIWQMDESGGQWAKGKSAPGFMPVGPYLVPAGEIDASDVRLRSFVNGEARQDSTTADMIHPLGVVLHHVSQYFALEAGDLVSTGSPEGVAMSGRFPFLAAGDVVTCAIDGLGTQRHRIVTG